MPLSEDFLEKLTPLSLDDFLKKIKQDEENGGVILNLRNEIKPIDLFCYLYARFGPPNGVQNFLRNDCSDNLVHWDWTLFYEDSVISFWGGNFQTDLIIKCNFQFGENEKENLANKIKLDLRNYGKKINEIKENLEHWMEFVNPYWRLSQSIKGLRKELISINLNSDFPNEFNTPITAINNKDEWIRVSNSYSKAFGLCFGIRSMLPVKAEAFINLVIFVMCRPDIKNDSRLLDNLFRQQIDIRVKSLHINCIGFENAVDFNNSACKAFHSLINERNDILHGNVAPEKQKFNDVCFWGKVPVFNEYKSLWDRTHAIDHKAMGLDRLQNEIETVDNFINYILSCMTKDLRDFMHGVINKRDLAKNKKTGGFGILFPDHLIQGECR